MYNFSRGKDIYLYIVAKRYFDSLLLHSIFVRCLYRTKVQLSRESFTYLDLFFPTSGIYQFKTSEKSVRNKFRNHSSVTCMHIFLNFAIIPFLTLNAAVLY